MILISLFSFLFLKTSQEWNNVQSIQEFLDENISVSNVQLSENSTMYDKDGKVIVDIYGEMNRIYLPYDHIPSYAVDAILAAEDQTFFQHQGFDMKGITRAFLINVQNQSLDQGGSTVTQQLARNLFLTHEKSFERKLTELLYAYQLEKQYTKEKILELYLNGIYFQNGVYGIEAASRFYFNKPSKELTLAETAFLCAIPNNPQRFNPLTNKEETHIRKNWILEKMYETNKISKDTYEEALGETITLSLGKKMDGYPDYATYVFHELELLIGEVDGYNQKIARAATPEAKDELLALRKNRVETLLQQGITIETALDTHIQNNAKGVIGDLLGNSDLEAATAIIDHRNHEIVAITGGKNYRKFDFHRGYQAYRQPGSSIKPLLVFAPYIEKMNVTEKSPVDASPFRKNNYQPQNFGGAVYGNVTMEQAFKHSYNTAAVRMLDIISPEHGFAYLDAFEFSRLNPEDMILPAALGGLTHGVSVLEMTQAFTTFGTDGVYHSPRAIRYVKDKHGHILYTWNKAGKEVWSQETNHEMKKMLRRVVTEGTGRQAHFNATYLGGKTGTTNNYHDLWFIGATEHYTGGIWLGYDQPKPIANRNRSLHLQIWRSIMTQTP
ncbi:penicillin-binding protein 1A [Evansella vedderi]|uniref:Penicillin-binding protein 1A n=1 Tax=Evansella vedderi TaxID=38282 RepID=A0ABU0A0J9_9BACI|nr:penicillin-binding protein 1A [Evansella vedderi]